MVDNVHANSFNESDIDSLLARVASRGFSVEFLGNQNFSFFFTSERLELLEEQLPTADALAVILPRADYTKEEMDIVTEFVSDGGRLLLIADPSRRHAINSVADSFGILFETGYLYNLVENELNYQNIFIRDFRSDELTEDVQEMVFYAAGSVRSSGVPLAFTDENTYSSMVERVESFTPIVKSDDGRILALGDLTFLIPPHDSTLDNARFISNVAEFLTTGERSFDLVDFPRFFKGDVDILLGDSDLFDLGTQVRSVLSKARIGAEIRGVDDLTNDAVFLGLYRDSPAVAQYLAVAGIQLGDEIRTPFTSDILADGTAILLLHREQTRWVLVVLGETRDALTNMVRRLASDAFRSGLVSDFLGVYQVLESRSDDSPERAE